MSYHKINETIIPNPQFFLNLHLQPVNIFINEYIMQINVVLG